MGVYLFVAFVFIVDYYDKQVSKIVILKLLFLIFQIIIPQKTLGYFNQLTLLFH